MATATKAADIINNVSNDGEFTIDQGAPYVVEIGIRGVCPLLFHRWSCDDVEAKANAAKGSTAKKTDNIESYVYRNEDGELCIPAEYVRQAIIWGAKYKQDPRSPRKSAMDLFKAGIASITELASLGVKEWDYVDRRRVTVQRNGVTRERPAMREGWTAQFMFQVLLPEYINPTLLGQVLGEAGRVVGIADFRPTYGRFTTTKFQVIQDS